jgi:hypothetical protein
MDLGLVLTPEKTAEYMVSNLGNINPKDTILDPCVGPGIFVKTLLESGVKSNQIWAYDINGLYIKDLGNLGINFKQKDTLIDIKDEDHEKFDFIIGNPPYLNKSSDYIQKNKNRLKRIYGDINSHESYAMFLVNGIWRLKEGGILSFITSDSFLTLRSHTNLRRFILKNCQILEILLAPPDLFDDQGVNIYTSIITLKKCTGGGNLEKRRKNIIKTIPRITSEAEYKNPPSANKVMQKKYFSFPFNLFVVDLEEGIIDLFEEAPKLKDFLNGYIGMHTHNNRRFIAAIEGTKLAKIYKNRNKRILNKKRKYKIISEQEFKSGKWKPYLKRGGNDQYYRPILEALKWDEESIKIYDIPSKAPFEKEGIVISGVSSRLAARYMPPGCYWDSNKAIGFLLNDLDFSIEYFLGLLNSSLYNYLAKGIINNTNSIQISGINSLPVLKPERDFLLKIEEIVKGIIFNKNIKPNYDYVEDQKRIDNLIFDLYSKEFNIPQSLKIKLDRDYSIY